MNLLAAGAVAAMLPFVGISQPEEAPVSVRGARYDYLVAHGEAHSASGNKFEQHGIEATSTSARATLQTSPERLRAGQRARLTFSLTDSLGKPLNSLVTHHARKLHVMAVGDGMQVFAHVHPEDFGEPIRDGKATVFLTFPTGGTYLVIADFMTPEGAQTAHFTLKIAAPARSSASGTPGPQGYRVVTLEGGDRYTKPIMFSGQKPNSSAKYSISLRQPDTIRANEKATLVYRFSENGTPISDLRPYLDAPMHIAVVKDDLEVFLHEHGTLNDERAASPGGHASHHEAPNMNHHHRTATAFGPEIATQIVFPEEGTYYLFGQVARGDKMIVTRFPVQVHRHGEHSRH
ncbi:MAG: hypothetical protein ACREQZ_04130 [Woeseiaceae bacterium]